MQLGIYKADMCGTLPHWATVFCHRVTQSQRKWSQGVSVGTPRGSSKFHQEISLEYQHCRTNTNMTSLMTKKVVVVAHWHWKNHGSGIFRSPVFSLIGAKVPTGNICSLEQKFPWTFVPGSECYREHSFCRALYRGVTCTSNYKLHIKHKLTLKPIY